MAASNNGESNGGAMVDVALARIVMQEDADRQYIFLNECGGKRGFPIVIGNNEAGEIHRVVVGLESERPLTHQLCFNTIGALNSSLKRVDIVDLRHNTFFAQLVLQDATGAETAVIDARPSDAIALALRASCPIRVAEKVLALASVSDADEDESDQE